MKGEAADNRAAEPEPDSKILAVRPVHPLVTRPALTTETTKLQNRHSVAYGISLGWGKKP